MSTDGLWSVPVRVEDVGEEGRDFTLAADAETRSAIAQGAGVVDLPRLEAAFHLERLRNGGAHLTGTVAATVGQTCVVTLEPLSSRIEESVDLYFDPAAGDAAPANGGEHALHPDQEPPEPLVGGIVDLGAIAVEFLLLGIDPYPRKGDAVFSPPAGEKLDVNPFAALAALKKGLPEE